MQIFFKSCKSIFIHAKLFRLCKILVPKTNTIFKSNIVLDFLCAKSHKTYIRKLTQSLCEKSEKKHMKHVLKVIPTFLNQS
jgi:hypothetical protein